MSAAMVFSAAAVAMPLKDAEPVRVVLPVFYGRFNDCLWISRDKWL